MKKRNKHSNLIQFKSIELISDDMLTPAVRVKPTQPIDSSPAPVQSVTTGQNQNTQGEKKKFYPKPKKFKKPNIKQDTADRIMKESNFGKVKIINEYSRFFQVLQSVTVKSPRYHKFGLIEKFSDEIMDQIVKIRILNALDSEDLERLTYFNELIGWITICKYKIHGFYKTNVISKHGYINLIFCAESILSQLQKWNAYTKEKIAKNQKIKTEK